MVKVFAECEDELIDEDTVKFINIEEDFEGRDVLTFECPLCKKTHQSKRYGR